MRFTLSPAIRSIEFESPERERTVHRYVLLWEPAVTELLGNIGQVKWLLCSHCELQDNVSNLEDLDKRTVVGTRDSLKLWPAQGHAKRHPYRRR